MRRFGFGASLVSAFGWVAVEAADLQVTRVALFNSGVGYFECDGKVTGNATAELKFRTDQINDILKSLVVQDRDGGSIGTVSYASRDPIEKALKSFGVDITGNPTLGKLLDQLRGEPVEISGPRVIRGVIVGVETKRTIAGEQVVEQDVLNVLTDKGLEQLMLGDHAGIKLANEKIDNELRKALATLATAHDADKKSVALEFKGAGERRVNAAYLLETPIWKTSYRLVLIDDKKPFVQGWATVENATEEDWNNVRLSLVSGRPISFRMDLYTPIYIPRPLEQLELYGSLRPPSYEGGYPARMESAPAAAPMEAARRMTLRSNFEDRGFAGAAPDQKENGMPDTEALGLYIGSVQSVATALEAGELFEYRIQTPVSIPRQHSAMLPIVNQEIDAKKVSIYNPVTHPKFPLNGLELVNSTKLNLMQGPVTVFDGDTYAGDAKLPDLRPDEKRLIAYALDLSTEINIEQKPGVDELVSLKIAKGTLIHRHKYTDRREYVLRSKTNKERTIILEQPYSEAWTLVEPKQADEKTSNLLRFRVTLPAGETKRVPVELQRYGDTTVVLGSIGLDDIRIYVRGAKLSPKVKEALERVIALRTELDAFAREKTRLEQSHSETLKEQERIRANLQSLPQNTDQYQRQLKRFDEIDAQITDLKSKVEQARNREEQQRKELEAFLLSLDVE